MWDDYARFKASTLDKGEVMAINDIGQYLHEPLRHWVSLHPEFFPGWRFFRERHLYSAGYSLDCHAQKTVAGVTVTWHIENIGGSSGLFGAYLGLMMGYEEIVLAGIPMDNTQHFFDPPWYGHDLGDRANELVWRDARDTIFAGRVTSLSGRTREWLGEPVGLKKKRRAA